MLAETGDVLRDLTGDASLSGYQSRNPSRVATVAAAVYSVLQRRGIRYINPPASFEESGQKIRLPDRIFEHRLATCLDLAVLTAACIEQAGLNPLIVMKPGQAFVGLWLTDRCFADSATDSLLAVRKRVEINEICVFETTSLAAQPPVAFPAAVNEGRRELDDSSGSCCVIDIRRARRARVRPLPIRVERPVAAEAGGQADATAPAIVELPSVEQAREDQGSAAMETPATRLDRWKRKLLDLTLNNRLLSFRETKKTLGILCPDLTSRVDAKCEPVTGNEVMAVLHRLILAEQPDEQAAAIVADAVAGAVTQMRSAYATSDENKHIAEEEGVQLRDRIKRSYPFHPALIDVMKERWNSIPDFQRTRGALRFLAVCMYALKARGGAQIMLSPGDVPLQDGDVRQAFLTEVGQREVYQAVLESDITGRKARVCRRFTVSGFITWTSSSHPSRNLESSTQRMRKAGLN